MYIQNGASQIISVGHYLPKAKVRSSELLGEIDPSRFGVDDDLIEKGVGVVSMRHAAIDENPSDLAIKASEEALEKSGINLDQLDYIIFCGVTRNAAEPATAHWVQGGIGRKNVTCFDVGNACLGFSTGMEVANGLIGSKMARYVLVCSGEKLSFLSHLVIDELKKNPDPSILQRKLGFLTVGDAGGAAVIGPKEDTSGFLHFKSNSRGEYAEYCYYNIKEGMLEGQMIMDKICATGIRAHADLYNDYLNALGWLPENIDGLITHQVGRRPFQRFSQVFSVAADRMTRTYHKFGNIATSTFPVNYALGLKSGLIKKGKKILVAMSGSGVTVCQAGMIA